MIPAESRMREIRTSGSTSGGVETDRMGAGLSTKRKRGQEAPDPNRHRATPRLYSKSELPAAYVRLSPSGSRKRSGADHDSVWPTPRVLDSIESLLTTGA